MQRRVDLTEIHSGLQFKAEGRLVPFGDSVNKMCKGQRKGDGKGENFLMARCNWNFLHGTTQSDVCVAPGSSTGTFSSSSPSRVKCCRLWRRGRRLS